uniref:Putative ovule protein n=1 Tax=Solanum chacoense TaxID=4108 RepID=A0A0V0GIA0_SOLCH
MTTLLLCLIISVISPTLPLSWPDMTFTVSPSFTCILCSTGRLFGLHFFRSHRLSLATMDPGVCVDLTRGEQRGRGEKGWPKNELEEMEREVNEL